MTTNYLYLQQDETALHIACISNRADMVELLLKRGADMNIRDKVIILTRKGKMILIAIS